MEKEKKRVRKHIIKFLVVLGILVTSRYYGPLEVQAKLSSDAKLWVEDQTLVYNGKVVRSCVWDGEGGTAVYDESNNTLTLNNFHFEKSNHYKAFLTSYNMSTDSTLRIVLRGVNTMIYKDDERFVDGLAKGAIVFNQDAGIIEGSGKLITNVAIASSYGLLIQDCELVINGYDNGISGGQGDFTIKNAELTVTTEEEKVLCDAFSVTKGKLSISNSNVRVRTKKGNFQSVFVFMDNDTDTTQVTRPENKISLGSDMIVVDDAGNTLNLCGTVWCEGFRFAYSKTGTSGTWVSNSEVSSSVNFLSTNKTKENALVSETEKCITAIGTVSLKSGDAITDARKKYDALSENAKKRVSNYEKLVDAENTYAKLLEAEKVRQEEEAKKKAEENAKGDSSQGNMKYKVVEVNGKKYTIKTPEWKSVKSKKKKTVTLTWKSDTECNGYQIVYSTKKNFKNGKKVLIKSKKSKTKTLKNLTGKKTYYVRMREYKTINGKKYYGYFSTVKKVKVK